MLLILKEGDFHEFEEDEEEEDFHRAKSRTGEADGDSMTSMQGGRTDSASLRGGRTNSDSLRDGRADGLSMVYFEEMSRASPTCMMEVS